MDFKIGQTVELIDNRDMVALLGATAVVGTCGVYDDWDEEIIDVVWKTRFRTQCHGGYEVSRFKVVPQVGQLTFSFYKQL